MQSYTIPDIIAPGTVMNTNLSSQPYPVDRTYTGAIQVFFTGTPTGTFSLMGSCDPASKERIGTVNANYTTGPNAPVNFTLIANSNQAVTAAGDIMWNIQDLGYNWIKLVYTDTSGGLSTAVLTVATFNSKQI